MCDIIILHKFLNFSLTGIKTIFYLNFYTLKKNYGIFQSTNALLIYFIYYFKNKDEEMDILQWGAG